MSFRYNRTDTQMNSVTMAAHTGPEQIQARWGSSNEKGKWTWSPMPNQEVICKGKIGFLQWSLTGYINQTSE